MNKCFYIITLFFMIICATDYCMQQAPIFDWKSDLRSWFKDREKHDETTFEETKNFILDYAVDKYEIKGGIKLTDEQRTIAKKKFLKDILGI